MAEPALSHREIFGAPFLEQFRALRRTQHQHFTALQAMPILASQNGNELNGVGRHVSIDQTVGALNMISTSTTCSINSVIIPPPRVPSWADWYRENSDKPLGELPATVSGGDKEVARCRRRQFVRMAVPSSGSRTLRLRFALSKAIAVPVAVDASGRS